MATIRDVLTYYPRARAAQILIWASAVVVVVVVVWMKMLWFVGIGCCAGPDWW